MAANKHDKTGRGYSRKAQMPPGSLVYTGLYQNLETAITVFDYTAEKVDELSLEKAEHSRQYKDKDSISWINIDGLSDVGVVEQIGKIFGIHQLVLEDILNTAQRPKFGDYGDYIFVVAKMLSIENNGSKIKTEQVSFVVGNNFLLTFQECRGDIFGPIRNRLRYGQGNVRKMGADYLAYTLLDVIVDNYFVILENVGEEAEIIESELIANANEAIIHRIHSIKRRMISLRRSIWPLREVLSAMGRSESPLIADRTNIYIRDIYEHTIQVIDTVESLRDISSGMLETYLSAISNRMNAVMKVLTIIATIFIPLTFIAGVYGMNFEYMPELSHPWAYPAVLGIMFLISLGMLIFFRHKKWL